MKTLFTKNLHSVCTTGARGVYISLLLFCLLVLAVCSFSETVSAEGSDNGAETPAVGREERTFTALVETIQVHENYLLLDDERYLLTNKAECFNEWGRRISVRKLPRTGTLEIRYEKRPRTEEHPQGSREKILLELRIRSTPSEKGNNR